ncbi:MAG: TetR/AcrR family transcriptional regulator [Thermodesulfobacteriota bacterium]
MQTTDAILQAAGSLFAERGYDCTPLVDIAEQAGVATGTIIYHFKRKECLLAELALRHLRSLYACCQEQAAKGSSGLESVLLYVDGFHRHLREHPRESAAYHRNLPAEKLKDSPEIAPGIAAAERSMILLLQCLLILGVNDGSIGPRDVAASARSIQAMLLGGAFMALFQDGDPRALADDAARCVRRMLTDAVSAGRESA